MCVTILGRPLAPIKKKDEKCTPCTAAAGALVVKPTKKIKIKEGEEEEKK